MLFLKHLMWLGPTNNLLAWTEHYVIQGYFSILSIPKLHLIDYLTLVANTRNLHILLFGVVGSWGNHKLLLWNSNIPLFLPPIMLEWVDPNNQVTCYCMLGLVTSEHGQNVRYIRGQDKRTSSRITLKYFANLIWIWMSLSLGSFASWADLFKEVGIALGNHAFWVWKLN